MSLHLSPLFIHNLITESLNIESIEYSYFIPILAQKAEYAGDTKLVSMCNIMSQQVKQYFNYASHVHLYMSITDEYLKETMFLKGTHTTCEQIVNIDIRHKHYYYDKSEDSRVATINDVAQKIKLVRTSSTFLNSYEFETKILLKSLRKIDQNILAILKNIDKTLDSKDHTNNISTKFFAQNRNIEENSNYFLLLKNLQYRKLWKGKKWYPLLAKITYDGNMLNISKNILEISKIEKKMSKFLILFMKEK